MCPDHCEFTHESVHRRVIARITSQRRFELQCARRCILPIARDRKPAVLDRNGLRRHLSAYRSLTITLNSHLDALESVGLND